VIGGTDHKNNLHMNAGKKRSRDQKKKTIEENMMRARKTVETAATLKKKDEIVQGHQNTMRKEARGGHSKKKLQLRWEIPGLTNFETTRGKKNRA